MSVQCHKKFILYTIHEHSESSETASDLPTNSGHSKQVAYDKREK